MPDDNHDNDDAALALGAMFALFAGVSRSGWSRSAEGLFAAVTGCPVPTLNAVLASRRGASADGINPLLDEVAAAGFPYCLQSRDAAADEVAQARGFALGGSVPLMVLRDDSALAAALRVEGLQIRRLGPDDLGLHLDAVVNGFGMPAEILAPFVDSDLLRVSGISAYVGYLDGAPVTTGLAIRADDAIGVFNVGTPEEHRRRGFGAAVSAQAVADGLTEGASYALLQTSDLGAPVYRALGFQTVESWNIWVPQPAAA